MKQQLKKQHEWVYHITIERFTNHYCCRVLFKNKFVNWNYSSKPSRVFFVGIEKNRQYKLEVHYSLLPAGCIFYEISNRKP